MTRVRGLADLRGIAGTLVPRPAPGTSPRTPRCAGACEWRSTAIALVLFSANSRWTTGTWFVPAGFFVPENEALGQASLALEQVRESVYRLSGAAWVWPAYAGAALIGVAVARSRRRAAAVCLRIDWRRGGPRTRSIRVTRSGFATVCRWWPRAR